MNNYKITSFTNNRLLVTIVTDQDIINALQFSGVNVLQVISIEMQTTLHDMNSNDGWEG